MDGQPKAMESAKDEAPNQAGRMPSAQREGGSEGVNPKKKKATLTRGPFPKPLEGL
jgi:hypothetical protein